MQVAKQISSRSILLRSSHALRNVCALNNTKETYTTTNYSKVCFKFYLNLYIFGSGRFLLGEDFCEVRIWVERSIKKNKK